MTDDSSSLMKFESNVYGVSECANNFCLSVVSLSDKLTEGCVWAYAADCCWFNIMCSFLVFRMYETTCWWYVQYHWEFNHHQSIEISFHFKLMVQLIWGFNVSFNHFCSALSVAIVMWLDHTRKTSQELQMNWKKTPNVTFVLAGAVYGYALCTVPESFQLESRLHWLDTLYSLSQR